MTTELFWQQGKATLAAPIVTGGATSCQFTLATGSQSPPALSAGQQFAIAIDNELVEVTAWTGPVAGVYSATIVRAQGGSTATTHLTNALVYGVETVAGAQARVNQTVPAGVLATTLAAPTFSSAGTTAIAAAAAAAVLVGAMTGTVGAAVLTPTADATSAIGTSALRYTNVVTNTFQIFGAASDANPVYQNSSAGAVFGAGGASAVDLGLKRSAAGTLAVTNAGATNLVTIASGLIAAGTDNTQALGTTALRFTSVYAATSHVVYASATDNATLTHNALTWGVGCASPTISQATQTSDAACQSININPQAPYASAGTNVVGGSVNIKLAASISGTTYPNLNVAYGGTPCFVVQAYPGFPNTGVMYLGNVVASTANFALSGNGTSTNVNANTNGQITFTIGGNAVYLSIKSSPTGVFLGVNILSWLATTTPSLKQEDATGNSATGATFAIQAQNATGTTSIGGALNLTSGTGTTANGAVCIQNGGTTIAYWGATPHFDSGTALAPGITTGTFTPTAAQTRFPSLQIGTVTLTGDMTIAMPNAQGQWHVDLTLITLNGHNLFFSSGSATSGAITTISTKAATAHVNCTGSNAVTVG